MKPLKTMYKADLSAADQCVMCGMCQPHCPTYRTEQTETESPRGRLSVILGLAQSQLQADSSIITHLNHCTGCGACEAMCPSRVPFMQLIDNCKQLLPRKNLVLNVILQLVRQPGRYGILRSLLKNRQLGYLLRLCRLLPGDSKYLQKTIQLSPGKLPLADFYAASGDTQGNVGLFIGCITQLFDKTTLQDSLLLLTRSGYNVHILRQQVCCGALHQHNGDIDTARLLLKQNQQLFESAALDAVIFTATGCGAQLASHLKSINAVDIMQFIRQSALLTKLELQPLTAKVLVHEPCSQRNQLKLPAITDLICQIPGLTINNMIENQFCCGGGGINMLTVANSANKLRTHKLTDIESRLPDTVVTTNYGCALHLASGTQSLDLNKEIEFCHPVSLLVRSASLK
ncbi:MAG: (Fe-S)-binding protein [Gammaproteobacteria bacterium]|nr:(Fe-S)-binding protein [Gammaproteobacteria bacterium]